MRDINRFVLFLIFLPLFIPLVIQAEPNIWKAVNDGIGAEGEFEVRDLIAVDGQTFAYIRNVKDTSGEWTSVQSGIYLWDQDSLQWDYLGGDISKYGFERFVGTWGNLYGVRDDKIFQLKLEDSLWIEIVDFSEDPLPGINKDTENESLFEKYTAAGKYFYGLRGSEESGFFVLRYDLETGERKELKRFSEYPLPGSGDNDVHDLAATLDGKVYMSYKWKHVGVKEPSTLEGTWYGSTNAVFEWDGTRWTDISAGLNMRNLTGSGLGPIKGTSTNEDRTRVFAATEQGYYERIPGGWQLLGVAHGNKTLYGVSHYLFIGMDRLDTAVKARLGNGPDFFYGCYRDNHRHLTSPDSGKTFFVNFQDRVGDACDKDEESFDRGIWRLVLDESEIVGKVQNLHLETAGYLGTPGDNSSVGIYQQRNGQIVIAANYNPDGEAEAVGGLANTGPGHLLVLDTLGQSLLKEYVLPGKIADIDHDSTTGHLALVGEFGVLVLQDDISAIVWQTQDSTKEDSRIAISEEGEVVALVRADSGNGDGYIRYYDSTGQVKGTITERHRGGTHITDIEFSSKSPHRKIYVSGFVQATSTLQIAYLDAWDMDDISTRVWKTWGYDPNEETRSNGADTRAYHIAINPNHVYVAGESAGGGPGGFSIFAYNGIDLETKTATGGDNYANGTNSCGACHITYLGRIDPLTGEVKKGLFLHARLSSGKTNTHKVADGSLMASADDELFLGAVSAAHIEGRDALNINGSLVGEYAGADMVYLHLAENMRSRIVWTVFSKEKGGGYITGITERNGIIAFVGTSTQGLLHTTATALEDKPFNMGMDNAGNDSLLANEIYYGVLYKDVWNHANQDGIEFREFSNYYLITQDVTITPYIIRDEARFLVRLNAPGKVRMIFYDIRGRETLNTSRDGLEGFNEFYVDMRAFNAGIHYVRVFYDGKVGDFKLTVD